MTRMWRNLRRWLGWADDRALGPRAEAAAARHLRKLGYRMLARNLHLPAGEIDLLAEDPGTGAIAIVEVKATTSEDPPPEVHVDPRKRRKLTMLARQLAQQRRFENRLIRFDVVGVVWPECQAEPTRITHHPGAFEAGF